MAGRQKAELLGKNDIMGNAKQVRCLPVQRSQLNRHAPHFFFPHLFSVFQSPLEMFFDITPGNISKVYFSHIEHVAEAMSLRQSENFRIWLFLAPVTAFGQWGVGNSQSNWGPLAPRLKR